MIVLDTDQINLYDSQLSNDVGLLSALGSYDDDVVYARPPLLCAGKIKKRTDRSIPGLRFGAHVSMYRLQRDNMGF